MNGLLKEKFNQRIGYLRESRDMSNALANLTMISKDGLGILLVSILYIVEEVSLDNRTRSSLVKPLLSLISLILLPRVIQ